MILTYILNFVEKFNFHPKLFNKYDLYHEIIEKIELYFG